MCLLGDLLLQALCAIHTVWGLVLGVFFCARECIAFHSQFGAFPSTQARDSTDLAGTGHAMPIVNITDGITQGSRNRSGLTTVPPAAMQLQWFIVTQVRYGL